MKLSLASHTYKRIAILALLIGVATNYYVIAIVLDVINISLASSRSEATLTTISYPLSPALQVLAPLSYISLLISIIFYIKFRRSTINRK